MQNFEILRDVVDCEDTRRVPFDYLVGAGENFPDREAKGFGGFEVEDQLGICRRLDWEVRRLGTLQGLVA